VIFFLQSGNSALSSKFKKNGIVEMTYKTEKAERLKVENARFLI